MTNGSDVARALVEDDRLDRIAVAEAVDVVVVIVGAGRPQHDEVAAAAIGAHAHVILVHVVAATLGDPEPAGRPHHVGGIAGDVILVARPAARRRWRWSCGRAGGEERGGGERERREAAGATKGWIHESIRERR